MTSSDHQVSPRYPTPEEIRDVTFPRRMMGLDANRVYEYIDLLADQVQAAERELSHSRAENERLQPELRRVQAELDEFEDVGERVNDQVVQLFSQAQLVAEVRPQVGGIVLERPFREGGEVDKGALLYQVDPATYRAAFATAQANLAKAKASADSARAKAQRYRQLVAIKAVSAQDLDDAEANLRLVEAEIAGSEAALETARINLDFTRVTAPIAGRIGKSAVTAGALVTANQAERRAAELGL